jgi:hypothetical protein
MYYLCQQRIYLCPLYQNLVPYDKYDNIDQIFLDNGTCYFVYHPLDQDIVVYSKVLFFFNDCSGNASSHYAIVRLMQRLFPEYTIVQFEYSGFGFSFESKLLLEQIQKATLQSFEFVFEERGLMIDHYIFFGYKFGAYIVSYLSAELNSSFSPPKKIFFYNPTNAIFETFDKKLPFPFFMFVCPSFRLKTAAAYLNKICHRVKLYIIESDSCKESFYYMANNPLLEKKHLHLEGTEKFSLLFEKNFDILEKFVQEINYSLSYR